MTRHAQNWIDAYLDGELTARQQQQAESHLADCPDCQRLLAERRALSTLLQQVPQVESLKPKRRFLAEVELQLASRQAGRSPARLTPAGQKALGHQALYLAWQLIPVLLLLAIAFIQTVFTLRNLVRLIPGAEQAISGLAALTAGLKLSGDLGAPSALRLFNPLGIADLLRWSWSTAMIALATIAVLYLSWLASWWAYRLQKEGSG